MKASTNNVSVMIDGDRLPRFHLWRDDDGSWVISLDMCRHTSQWRLDHEAILKLLDTINEALYDADQVAALAGREAAGKDDEAPVLKHVE